MTGIITLPIFAVIVQCPPFLRLRELYRRCIWPVVSHLNVHCYPSIYLCSFHSCGCLRGKGSDKRVRKDIRDKRRPRRDDRTNQCPHVHVLICLFCLSSLSWLHKSRSTDDETISACQEHSLFSLSLHTAFDTWFTKCFTLDKKLRRHADTFRRLVYSTARSRRLFMFSTSSVGHGADNSAAPLTRGIHTGMLHAKCSCRVVGVRSEWLCLFRVVLRVVVGVFCFHRTTSATCRDGVC